MVEPRPEPQPHYKSMFRLDVATLPWSDPVKQYPGNGDGDKEKRPHKEISTVEQSVSIGERPYTVQIKRVETKNLGGVITGLAYEIEINDENGVVAGGEMYMRPHETTVEAEVTLRQQEDSNEMLNRGVYENLIRLLSQASARVGKQITHREKLDRTDLGVDRETLDLLLGAANYKANRRNPDIMERTYSDVR